MYQQTTTPSNMFTETATTETLIALDPRFEMNSFKILFLSCINMELNTRVTEAEEAEIIEFLLHVGTEYKLHTLMTNLGIDQCVNEIFTKERIRDFILSLTDRFYIELSGEDNEERMITLISNGLLNKKFNEFTRTPKEFFERIHSDINIPALLSNNNWLVTVVMIFLVFPNLQLSIVD